MGRKFRISDCGFRIQKTKNHHKGHEEKNNKIADFPLTLFLRDARGNGHPREAISPSSVPLPSGGEDKGEGGEKMISDCGLRISDLKRRDMDD
jgi:hypothetical protein